MYPIMEHVCGKMTAHLNADGLIGTAIDAKEVNLLWEGSKHT